MPFAILWTVRSRVATTRGRMSRSMNRMLLSLVVVFAGLCAGFAISAEPVDPRGVTAALSQPVAEAPRTVPKGPSDWRWNVKSCRSGYGYTAWWGVKNPKAMAAAIESETQECAAKGINTVILETRYILGAPGDRDFWACPPLGEMIPRIRKYVDIAHRHGLKVISHLTVYIASDDYAARHPRQRQWNVVL